MEGSSRKNSEIMEAAREETRRTLSKAVDDMCDNDSPGAFAFVHMQVGQPNKIISNLGADELTYMLRIIAKAISDDEMDIEQ